MWPFKKKGKLKLIKDDEVESLGGLVRVKEDVFLLVELENELYMLPLYEFLCSQQMYKVSDTKTIKPSKVALDKLGFGLYGGHLSIVDS